MVSNVFTSVLYGRVWDSSFPGSLPERHIIVTLSIDKKFKVCSVSALRVIKPDLATSVSYAQSPP